MDAPERVRSFVWQVLHGNCQQGRIVVGGVVAHLTAIIVVGCLKLFCMCLGIAHSLALSGEDWFQVTCGRISITFLLWIGSSSMLILGMGLRGGAPGILLATFYGNGGIILFMIWSL